jgi:ABC-type lipoprotein export system ATPase subunit
MIKLNKVSKTYRTDKVETLALKDVDLHVRKGEFVAMMGPSGCGKSTLLNLIGLLDRPGQGSIEVEGIPVTRYRDKQVAALRNQTFGFIFQSFHLVSDLRAIDNGAAFNGKGPQPAFAVQDGLARKTLLTLGASDGKVVEVAAGARAGERFIVSSTAAFKDLDSIRITH